MTRTVVITQPTYLPWLGYFEQVARADVFIFLDTVQFVQRSWHSRNRLKGHDNQLLWLTVPVMAHPQKTPLLDIRLSPDQPQWRKKHLMTIQTCLGSAPYFSQFFPLVQDWLTAEYDCLVDLNISGIKMFSQLLGLSPQFLRASDLESSGHKTQLLLNLCKQVNGDKYYSSAGSREYMELEEYLFAEAGIQLVYQAWEHPIYPQRGEGFISHLSILDTLANMGIQTVRDYLCVTL